MHKARYNEHASPLFKQSSILMLNDLYNAQLGLLMYNFVHLNLPNPLLNIFSYRATNHNTRHGQDPSLPNFNLELARRTFMYRGPELWLKLEPNIKSANSKGIFKNRLTRELVSHY